MFISHPDFYNLKPINVYHKEIDENGKSIFDREDPNDPITVAHPEELRNKHIIYRKRFSLSKFSKAVLRISADDYYKLYLNGRYVAEGPTAGYPQAYFYNEVDVTEFLHTGENLIAVHCYYQGLINRVWVSGDLRQMLWCELYIDGEKILESDLSCTGTLHDAHGHDRLRRQCCQRQHDGKCPHGRL